MGMIYFGKQYARHAPNFWSRISRIPGLTIILGGTLSLGLLFNPAAAFSANIPTAQGVTLVWSPSLDAKVTGYNIYYGTASGTYTNMTNVGNVTNATISGLVIGATYYFAATSYYADGSQSGFSTESSYVVPTALSALKLRRANAGQFTVSASGLVGHTYQILATHDLSVWTVIGTTVVNAGGLLEFTDTNAASFAKCFYRTQEIP